MATALKLKADIKNLKAAINSKATPKSYLPKLKAQLEKAENELESVQKGSKPRKTSTTKKTATTLSALQKLIKKKEFSIYKNSGVDLKKDASESAMKTGRRVSKGLKSNQYGSAADNKGNVYYEYRPNRIDVKQPKRKQTYPKLEMGGGVNGVPLIDKDSFNKNKRIEKGSLIIQLSKKENPEYYYAKYTDKYDADLKMSYGSPHFEDVIYDIYNTINSQIDSGGTMADGGMMDGDGYMAKGGEIKKEDIVILGVPRSKITEWDWKSILRMARLQDGATFILKDEKGRDVVPQIEYEWYVKDKMADGGKLYARGGGVDKKYTHFAVRKSDNLILTGWDYKGVDKESISYYTKMDLKDMDVKPSDYKILSKTFLKAKGIDPFSWDNWVSSNKMEDGGMMAKGGEVEALYTKLIREFNKEGYEKMGTPFVRFVDNKIDSAYEKGDYTLVRKLNEVKEMYENDFYERGGSMEHGGELHRTKE